MCERKPLYNGLKIQIQNNQLTILDKSGHNIVNRIKKLKTAGSYASVFIVDCVTKRDKFSVVVKKQDSSNSERRRGLKYEKMIYDLMTKLVNIGACPFFIRNYNILAPDNILVTETFPNVMDLRTYLTKLDKIRGIEHENACRNLIIQFLYAIEVNFRIGIRHNDLHMKNILIRPCPPRDYHLIYVTRDRKNKKRIEMPNCDIMTLIFDNDRVTKLAPKNSTIDKIFGSHPSPKPVTNLFPWHEPRVRTERLDLFKVMQQIYDHVKSNYMRTLLKDLKLSFSSSELKNIQNKLAQGVNLVKLDFQRFYLITNATRPGSNASHHKEPLAPPCSQTTNNLPCTVGTLDYIPHFPSFLTQQVSSSEDAILYIIDLVTKGTNSKSHKIGDMSKLYAKTIKKKTAAPTTRVKSSRRTVR